MRFLRQVVDEKLWGEDEERPRDADAKFEKDAPLQASMSARECVASIIDSQSHIAIWPAVYALCPFQRLCVGGDIASEGALTTCKRQAPKMPTHSRWSASSLVAAPSRKRFCMTRQAPGSQQNETSITMQCYLSLHCCPEFNTPNP